MTLQLRPTFSESWYRVANLRAKLRSSAQISRQHYRGERWYVVRDPAGNQYHRLSEPAYRFVGLLDGTRTVSEAWDLVGGTLADDAPTQPEVIQILSHLYSANLIDADVTPDATVLLRRHKKLSERKFKNRLMNVLFPRIPLWDPDRFLKMWMPIVRVLFSKFGALVWLAVIALAVWVVLPQWGRIEQSTRDSISPGNWLWLWGVFVFVKLIHELGHAFACRRFGGECHELGIMFLVFIPTPYVDASSAWGFPNKWHKIFVGAAGMIVELFFAAVCAFVWANTSSGTLLNQLAFNAMLVASVSTVIFNANPLLRYDGYYMLSDYLEIPNLRQKSTEYTLGLIKRHVFRVKAHQPLPPPVQRIWLFLYCVTSSIYRVFVGFMIMLLVAFQIPILGILMAVGGLITWLLVPVFKTFKYLTIEPELHRKRGRATAFTLTVAAAVIVLIGIIPFWVNIDAMGVMEPLPENKQVLHAEVEGFVEEVAARDGQRVKAGDVILRLSNKPLEAQRDRLKGQWEEYDALATQYLPTDKAQYRVYRKARDQIDKDLKLVESRLGQLTLRAAIDGELIAPQLHELHKAYLPRGQEVAMIVSSRKQLIARVVLEQRDAGPVLAETPRTELRPAGEMSAVLPAVNVRPLPAAPRELPSAVLGQSGGADLPVDPQDPSGRTAQVPQFEVGVTVDNPGEKYHPGQRAYVRFKLNKRPLIWQWGRRLFQLIQTKSGESEWN